MISDWQGQQIRILLLILSMIYYSYTTPLLHNIPTLHARYQFKLVYCKEAGILLPQEGLSETE